MGRVPREPEQKPLTALIDVTFLLLIFFLVTLDFRKLEGRLDSALPKDRGGPGAASPVERLDVEIRVRDPGRLEPDPATATGRFPDGRLEHFVGRVLEYQVGTHRLASLAELRDFLRSFDPAEDPVRVHPHRGTIYADVIGVLDVVIETGFENISFSPAAEEE